MNVEDHLRLVHHVTKRLHRKFPTEPYEDLYQMGCIGLVKAVRGFDPDRGFQFSTYAVTFIRGAIEHGMRYGNPVHISRGDMTIARQIGYHQQEDASPEDIAARYGCSVAQAKRAKQVARLHIGTLDAPISDDVNIALLDILPDYSDYSAAIVTDFIASLPEQRRKILQLRLQGYDQRAIARKLNISQAYVSRHLRSIGQQYLAM